MTEGAGAHDDDVEADGFVPGAAAAEKAEYARARDEAIEKAGRLAAE